MNVKDPRDLAALAVAVAESFEASAAFTRRIWRGSCDHLGGRVALYRFCADVSARLLEALSSRPETDYPGCRDYELPEVFRDRWIERFNRNLDSLHNPEDWPAATVQASYCFSDILAELAEAAVREWLGDTDVAWDVHTADGNSFQVVEPDFEAAYCRAKELTNLPIVKIEQGFE